MFINIAVNGFQALLGFSLLVHGYNKLIAEEHKGVEHSRATRKSLKGLSLIFFSTYLMLGALASLLVPQSQRKLEDTFNILNGRIFNVFTSVLTSFTCECFARIANRTRNYKNYDLVFRLLAVFSNTYKNYNGDVWKSSYDAAVISSSVAVLMNLLTQGKKSEGRFSSASATAGSASSPFTVDNLSPIPVIHSPSASGIRIAATGDGQRRRNRRRRVGP